VEVTIKQIETPPKPPHNGNVIQNIIFHPLRLKSQH
jgi:hypothetical protein